MGGVEFGLIWSGCGGFHPPGCPRRRGSTMPRGGSERFARFPVREDRRPFAWLRACVVHIGPPDQFAPTAPLLPYFFAGYADRRSASMVFSVHGGEHALVVRRTHALRAAHHEGYRAVVRDSNCFLKVSLFSPARDAGIACVPITGGRRRIIWRVETTLCTSITKTRSIASIQRSSGDRVTSPV